MAPDAATPAPASLLDRLIDRAPRQAAAALRKAGIEALHLQRLRSLAAEVEQRWIGAAPAPRIVVLESMADPRTPAAAREADLRQQGAGALGQPRAFLMGETIYLVASAVPTRAAALASIAHESVGHWGLRGFFGDRLDAVLDLVAQRNRLQVWNKARDYGLDMADPQQRREAAEEVLAEIASEDRDPSLEEMVEAVTRAALRELVPSMRDEPFSRAELLVHFIAPARERLHGRATSENADGLAAFDRWFHGSKAVDDDGLPLPLFHGTTEDFSAFDPATRGRKTGAADARTGFFFAENPRAAEQFTWNGGSQDGANLMPVYLAMRNPLIVDDLLLDGASGSAAGALMASARERGHDGVIFTRSDMLGHTGRIFAVFEPTQIKSAIGNRGTWSPRDPDIRFRRDAAEPPSPPAPRARAWSQPDLIGGFAGPASTVRRLRQISSRGEQQIVELPNRNELGQRLAGTEQALENFWDWYEGSALVDDDEAPIVLYHGTKADVARFETMRETRNTGLFGMPYDARRAGIFLTPDVEFAQSFAGEREGANVMPCYVRMMRPLDLRRALPEGLEQQLEEAGYNSRLLGSVQYHWELFDEEFGGPQFVAALKRCGYDGAIFEEEDEERRPRLAYVAFDPAQVKSALGNRGSWSASSDDVRFDRASAGPAATGGAGQDGQSSPAAAFARRAAMTLEQRQRAFADWFGPSRVRHEDGSPRIVYHGTTGDFTVFSRKRSNPAGDWGCGHYFSSSRSDVAANYAGFGPDLIARIEEEVERELQDMEERDDEQPVEDGEPYSLAARVRARVQARMTDHEGLTMPVYLSIRDPFVVGGSDETVFDYEPEHYDDTDSLVMESGSLLRLFDAIRTVFYRSGVTDCDASEGIDDLRQEALNNNGMLTAREVVEILQKSFRYASSPDTGEIIREEVLRQVIEAAGFDGVIDHTVYQRFGVRTPSRIPMGGMSPDTVHYIAFKPEQVKSAIGNRGTWSASNPDIRFDRGLRQTGATSTSPRTADAALRAWSAGTSVTHEDGTPKVVYHGTNQDIRAFSRQRLGANTGAISARKGFFFTEDPREAAEYAVMSGKHQVSNAPQAERNAKRLLAAIRRAENERDWDRAEALTHELEASEQEAMSGEERGANVMPVYLRILKPLVHDCRETANLHVITDLAARAQREGYDGLKLLNVYDPVAARPEAFTTTQWVAFDPAQIKSATGNRGTYSARSRDIRFARTGLAGNHGETATPAAAAASNRWSARLAGQILQGPTRASAAQWTGWIRGLAKKGVRKEEVDWSGLLPWLQEQPADARIDRAQLLAQLAHARIDLVEVYNVSPDALLDILNARLAPLGYRAKEVAEYLLELQDEAGNRFDIDDDDLPAPVAAVVRQVLANDFADIEYPDHAVPGQGRAARELQIILGSPIPRQAGREASPRYFSSPHWQESNVIVHLRADERAGADGSRVLQVHEIQSDWAQQGRRNGFDEGGPLRIGRVGRDMLSDGSAGPLTAWDQYGTRIEFSGLGYSSPDEFAADLRRAMEAGYVANPHPPRAPLVERTASWVALAVRRAMRLAAEEGFDAVTFANGEQAALANRVDWTAQTIEACAVESLPRHVALELRDASGSLRHRGVVDEAGLRKLLGEEWAGRVQGALDQQRHSPQPSPRCRFDNVGLPIRRGGDGLRAFYDKVVPAIVRDTAAQYAARAHTGCWLSESALPADAPREQIGIRIDEALRSRLTEEPLPIFDRTSMGDDHVLQVWADLDAARRDRLRSAYEAAVAATPCDAAARQAAAAPVRRMRA